ncbi:MAG: tRNA pseudouridine(54/55) synthase Pus10 [Candidatus Nezhaarchaeales archaeon]
MLNITSEIIEKAVKLLEKASLCDKCLGRFFANLGFALTNKTRGESIKTMLCMAASALANKGNHQEAVNVLCNIAKTGFKPAKDLLVKMGFETPETTLCEVCRGLLDHPLQDLINKALALLSEYEFDSFLVGCKVPGTIIEKEDNLRSYAEIEWGESIKREINREAGIIITSKTGKNASFQKPDILIILDFHKMDVEIKPFPIFIYGRYRKLVRGIPQSRWLCPKCRGKGCAECNWTGKRYETSIEELVTEPMIKKFEAVKAKFHGAGREDIDVRVLGSGRPFVVEIIEPKKRFIDLKELQEEINEKSQGKIEVIDLTYADKSLIGMLKLSAKIKKKTYRALIEAEEQLSEERLKALAKHFNGLTIRQRTPTRVLHRRADKLRLKKVYEVKIADLRDKTFEAIIRCQGGLYVKELIHGDNGRTTPSFQEFLGVKLKVLELDVIDVEG